MGTSTMARRRRKDKKHQQKKANELIFKLSQLENSLHKQYAAKMNPSENTENNDKNETEVVD